MSSRPLFDWESHDPYCNSSSHIDGSPVLRVQKLLTIFALKPVKFLIKEEGSKKRRYSKVLNLLRCASQEYMAPGSQLDKLAKQEEATMVRLVVIISAQKSFVVSVCMHGSLACFRQSERYTYFLATSMRTDKIDGVTMMSSL